MVQSYSKLRKLNVEIANARDTSDTLDGRITADDAIVFSDLPTGVQRIFFQSSAPSLACGGDDVDTNDVWIDSDTYINYRYDGTSWSESYAVLPYTSISAGKIVVQGLSQNLIDSYGPLVPDPNFVLTTANDDYNFWIFSDSAIDWDATYGENGPGLRYTGNSEDNDAYIGDGGGTTKYIPVSPNDKIYIQTRVKKDGDWDADGIKFRIYALDEDKSSLGAYITELNPSVANTWETITGQITLDTYSDIHFIYFRLRGVSDATEGYFYVDNVNVWKEPQANFRHASDETTIDGGDIYTGTVTANAIAANTITASEIKGSGFGTLTLTSGKIEINVAEGIAVKNGADITMEAVTGSQETNRSKIIFVADNANFEIASDYDNDRLAIYPSVGGTGSLRLGYDWGSTLKQFSTIYAIGNDIGVYGVVEDANNYAYTYNSYGAESSSQMAATYNGYSTHIKVRTSTASTREIEISGIWVNLALTATTSGAVDNNSLFLNSSDSNHLYWKDSGGSSHALY